MANQLQVLKQTLNTPAMIQQVEAALPKHIPTDRFLRTTMTVLSQNPDLVKCERNSLMSSIMSAASLGLMPESFLGQAYIIPYKGKATLQVGYKGMIALARRSGEIKSIDSGVTYEKDEVSFVTGLVKEFEVKPYLEGDPGPAKLVWCVIHLKDGGYQIEVMTVAQIEAIRKAAPSGNSPAWKNSWDSMARKICIKRALKYAPLSTDLSQAIGMDDANESGAIAYIEPESGLTVDQSPVDDEPPAAPKKKTRLSKLKDEKAAEPEPRGPLGDNESEPAIEGELV